MLVGFSSAYKLRWVNDDIFITLRYAENWLNGNGLVYNVGERVEGYTHFLWLCLIALFQRLGLNPVNVTEWLGLISYAAVLVVCAAISLKSRQGTKALFPLATVILALHFDFKIWATSGLETSLFTLQIALTLFVLLFWQKEEKIRILVAGMIMTLNVMTRPDGAVFFAVFGLFVVIQSWARGKQPKSILIDTLYFSAAFFVLFLPYFAWKYSYYGDIFPNTYYAKSGGLSNFDQGFFYIYTFLRGYPSSLLMFLGVVFLFLRLKSSKDEKLIGRFREMLLQPTSASVILMLTAAAAYSVLFVARVGGDFMYARFLSPVIPLLYLSAEIGMRHLLADKRKYLFVLLVSIPLLVLYEKSLRDELFIEPNGQRKPAYQLQGITDEYWYWTQTETFNGINPIEANELIGRQLEQYFRGTKVQVLLRGQASLGYYGQFYQCVENAGLTDSFIAHLPLQERGRPGHEKNAPLNYLVERRVHFVFFRSPYDTSAYRFVNFKIGGGYGRAEMFIYDRELMSHLHKNFPKEILFTDFEAYLDQYISAVKSKKRDEVERDYAKFKDFYFGHNGDQQRERKFLQYLGK